jgi:ribosomal protein L19E
LIGELESASRAARPPSELPFFVLFGNSGDILKHVGIVDRKQALFENIVRLRRAGRDLPANRDLAIVRLALERELGETVSRRLAARLLGVSHTALERWIKTRDLPMVHSSTGRQAIPVPALLDLYEAVHAQQADGPSRYALTPTMSLQRQAARRLCVPTEASGERSGHDRARARSLAYHEAIARRLRKPMVSEARHVLFRWLEEDRIDPRHARQWERLLEKPIPVIRREITAKGAGADDLRQNSPFAGMLSEPERRRIVAEVR